jgi:hypothetical protein
LLIIHVLGCMQRTYTSWLRLCRSFAALRGEKVILFFGAEVVDRA